MKELSVILKKASVDIVDREAFEKNINDVVSKYRNYTVTSETIKDDKTVLASLRKLVKQLSDKRIEIKKELTEPISEFESYVKKAKEPLDKVIERINSDIKEFEEHQKTIKLEAVKDYVANKSADYLLDARLFYGKLENYTKVADFKSDGATLKKATMQRLDDMITFELQKQQEEKKAMSTISGQCAEYGMTDQPYLRMLKDLTVLEVIEQIKSDYVHEQQRRKEEEARLEREREQQKQETDIKHAETKETVSDKEIYQETKTEALESKPEAKIYTQTMSLEVYFENTEEKDRFKQALLSCGFEFGKNYWIDGYRKIEPITQEELVEVKS